MRSTIFSLILISIGCVSSAMASTGSQYAWGKKSSRGAVECHQLTPEGYFIAKADNNICRKKFPTRNVWVGDKYAYCEELTPNDEFVSFPPEDACRKSQPTRYAWARDPGHALAICQEQTHSGAVVKKMDINFCRNASKTHLEWSRSSPAYCMEKTRQDLLVWFPDNSKCLERTERSIAVFEGDRSSGKDAPGSPARGGHRRIHAHMK